MQNVLIVCLCTAGCLQLFLSKHRADTRTVNLLTCSRSHLPDPLNSVHPRPPSVPIVSHASTSQTKHQQVYGPRGKEPTRYGDWEIKGRCTDFS